MTRYFSVSIGGLPSDSDVSINVDSFCEIKEMMDAFARELPHSFVRYKTQLIMNRPPAKFPHWGRVYMVKAVLENGDEIPVGYCNFEKTFFSSISIYWLALAVGLLSSLMMTIRSFIISDTDIALWSGMVTLLIAIIALHKHTATRIKLLYLMK